MWWELTLAVGGFGVGYAVAALHGRWLIVGELHDREAACITAFNEGYRIAMQRRRSTSRVARKFRLGSDSQSQSEGGAAC